MNHRKTSLKFGFIATLVAPLALSMACSEEDFAGCEASRTCPEEPAAGAGGVDSGEGGAAGEATGGTAGSAGTAGTAGAGGTSSGGSGGAAGEGGSASGGEGGSAPECTAHEDCDDGDAENGSETCVDGSCEPGNPPPTVMSVSPGDGDEDVEVDELVTIEFSEDIEPDSVSADSVSVSVGGRTIRGELEVSGSTLTFTPAERFHLLDQHTVTITTDVTDLEGAGLLEEFESSFVVRDGAWGAIERTPDSAFAEFPKVALDAAGNVLAAWTTRDAGAPAKGHYARWYRPGAGWGEPTLLAECTSCSEAALAVNAGGVAVVTYVEGTEILARQYRDGEWGAQDVALDALEETPAYRVAVADTGEVHVALVRREGEPGGLMARRTDASGAWQEPTVRGSDLSLLDTPSIAFDADGRGVFVWSAGDRIHYVTYDPEQGEWSARFSIAGSVAESAGEFRGEPVVALAPSGEGIAVWTSYDGSSLFSIRASELTLEGSFAEPALIKETTASSYTPRLAFDALGFTLAWNERLSGDGADVLTAHFRDGEWEMPPRRLNAAERPADHLGHVVLAADAAGNSVALWGAVRDASNNLTPTYSRYTAADDSWSSPARFFTLVEYADRPSPSLAFSRNGIGAVAYRYRFIENDGSDRFESQIAIFE